MNKDHSTEKGAAIAGAALFLVFAISKVYGLTKARFQRKKDQKAKKEAETREQEKQEEAELDEYFLGIVKGRVILDSNIWMDDRYDSVFSTLAACRT